MKKLPNKNPRTTDNHEGRRTTYAKKTQRPAWHDLGEHWETSESRFIINSHAFPTDIVRFARQMISVNFKHIKKRNKKASQIRWLHAKYHDMVWHRSKEDRLKMLRRMFTSSQNVRILICDSCVTQEVNMILWKFIIQSAKAHLTLHLEGDTCRCIHVRRTRETEWQSD